MDETLAALERAAEFLVNGGTRCQQDAALIRALIERERAGGERAQIVALTAERDALAGIVRGWHWLAVGPDEMGDYLHQRELIKASEPYASHALKVLATPAPAPPAAPRTS